MTRPDLRNPAHLIAFGLGAGLAPRAPGTAGTLAAVPLYLLLAPLPVAAYLAVVAALFALGVWACGVTARHLGSKDPGAIVWDEVVGFLLAMTAIAPEWPMIAAGFLLFRLFDVLKPWPVGLADRRLRGGLGIMVDDALAALYTLAALHLLDVWL